MDKKLKEKSCYCLLFAVIGIIVLVVKMFFVDKNVLGSWNKTSWIAAIIVTLGFISCGIFGGGCKTNKDNTIDKK